MFRWDLAALLELTFAQKALFKAYFSSRQSHRGLPEVMQMYETLMLKLKEREMSLREARK